MELAIKSVAVITEDVRMDKLSGSENAEKEHLKGRFVKLSQLQYYSRNEQEINTMTKQ